MALIGLRQLAFAAMDRGLRACEPRDVAAWAEYASAAGAPPAHGTWSSIAISASGRTGGGRRGRPAASGDELIIGVTNAPEFATGRRRRCRAAAARGCRGGRDLHADVPGDERGPRAARGPARAPGGRRTGSEGDRHQGNPDSMAGVGGCARWRAVDRCDRADLHTSGPLAGRADAPRGATPACARLRDRRLAPHRGLPRPPRPSGRAASRARPPMPRSSTRSAAAAAKSSCSMGTFELHRQPLDLLALELWRRAERPVKPRGLDYARQVRLTTPWWCRYHPRRHTHLEAYRLRLVSRRPTALILVGLLVAACGSSTASSPASGAPASATRLRRRHGRCVRGTLGHADDLLRTQRIARRSAHRTVRGGDRPGRAGELRRHDGPGGDDPRRGRRLPGRRLLRPGRRRARRGRRRRASGPAPRRHPRRGGLRGSRPTTGRGSACRVEPGSSSTTRGRSAEADLPTSIDAFTDPAWKGRIGWAPTNASFQSFVTAYRLLKGDDAAKAWLEGIAANEPKVYDGNDAVLAAVAAGEVEVGFVNHYYLMQQLAEQGESFPVRNHFLAGDDPGSLVNVAGAGILSTAKNPAAAQAFVDFLLSEESQTYFATETHEYPLIAGVAANPALPTLAEIESPGHRPVGPGRPRRDPQAPAGGRHPLGTYWWATDRDRSLPPADPAPPVHPGGAFARRGHDATGAVAARCWAGWPSRSWPCCRSSTSSSAPRARSDAAFDFLLRPRTVAVVGGTLVLAAAGGRRHDRRRRPGGVADDPDGPAGPPRVGGPDRHPVGAAVVRRGVRVHRLLRAPRCPPGPARAARRGAPAEHRRAVRRRRWS